ncbi:undecaprenyl-diphosphate phosphatase [Halobacteriaceae archaeon GCM10025711]
MDESVLYALAAGVLQGVFEWLPISSEGNVSLFMTVVAGVAPSSAVQLSLFLHAGTAVAATAYYRDVIADALFRLPDWRPGSAFDADTADLSFLAVATLASAATGGVAYLALDEVVTALTGGAFVALIGALLVLTGVLQRTASGIALGEKDDPGLVDALLVGAAQGVAVLPGVSRSGTTVSVLLFRGHDGPDSFRLSFLLSIPAAFGAGLLVVLDAGGLPSVGLQAAVVALAASAVVGYLTIDALMRVVHRVAFWGVCVGLGLLAMVGGFLLVLA